VEEQNRSHEMCGMRIPGAIKAIGMPHISRRLSQLVDYPIKRTTTTIESAALTHEQHEKHKKHKKE